MAPHQPLTLIFDADDTLWDSNIYFLEAEEAFVAAITEAGVAAEREQIADLVRRCEREIIRTHGYGRGPYVRALHQAVELLSELEDFRDRMRADVERIGRQLMHRHCELLPGVAATLEELAKRHSLILFTKGDPEEQMLKLERSGLGSLFSRVEIPAEKDVSAYRRLLASARLEPRRTFMIGNSPRSDINPAIAAGLRAVYIPHPHTWVMEQEELATHDDRVIVLTSFPRLLDIF